MFNAVKRVAVWGFLATVPPLGGLVVGAEVGHVVAHDHNQANPTNIVMRAGREGIDTAIGGELGLVGATGLAWGLYGRRRGRISAQRSGAGLTEG